MIFNTISFKHNIDNDNDNSTNMNPMTTLPSPFLMNTIIPVPLYDWKSVYVPNQNFNNYSIFNPINSEVKMNVLFKTNSGRKINIIINKDKTIRELFLEFFNKIDKEIYNEKDIYFIYNAQKINYN